MRLALLIATVALTLSSCATGGPSSKVSLSDRYKKCETPWHEKRYQAVLTGCEEYAQSNSPIANALIGNVYLYGLSTERNVDKASTYYLNALSRNGDSSDWLGTLGSALQLARIQRTPEGGNDRTAARKYYNIAVENSPEIYAPVTKAELGAFIGLFSDGFNDTKAAYPILKSSAESGAANGMLYYALLLKYKRAPNNDLYKASTASSMDDWKAQNYARSLYFLQKSVAISTSISDRGVMADSYTEAYLTLNDFGFTRDYYCNHTAKDNSSCGLNGAKRALAELTGEIRASKQADLAYDYLKQMDTAQTSSNSTNGAATARKQTEESSGANGASATGMCAGLAAEFERYMTARSAEAAKSGDMCPQFLATRDISNRAIKLYEQCPQMDPTGELLDYHLKTSQTAAKGAKDVCA